MKKTTRDEVIRLAVQAAVEKVGIEGMREAFGMKARNKRIAAGIPDFGDLEYEFDH